MKFITKIKQILKDNVGASTTEMMATVSIIGLLSSSVATSVAPALVKAHDTKRLADMHQMQVALELFIADNQGYPGGEFVLGQGNTSSFTQNGFTNDPESQSGFIYMANVPSDPSEEFSYVYKGLDNNRNYCNDSLCANYQITFSLEEDNSGHEAGEHRITSEGIY